MKRRIALLLAMACLGAALSSGAESSGQELTFFLRHGDKNSNRIAITVDDFFEVERGWEILDMCREYGIVMTLFPLGIQLNEKDREMWPGLIDAGCEIATHNFGHVYMGRQPVMQIIRGWAWPRSNWTRRSGIITLSAGCVRPSETEATKTGTLPPSKVR